jgi:hypothetical protein
MGGFARRHGGGRKISTGLQSLADVGLYTCGVWFEEEGPFGGVRVRPSFNVHSSRETARSLKSKLMSTLFRFEELFLNADHRNRAGCLQSETN